MSGTPENKSETNDMSVSRQKQDAHPQCKLHFMIVTRHYPPEISGGARRPFLYVNALRALGHKVTIVSPFGDEHDPDHIQIDHPVSHVAGIEQSSPSSETFSTGTNLRNLARTWGLWPDPEIRWCKRVQKHIMGAQISADWVITTSPPESLHCIGRAIANAANAKWLAEFRDTWIANPHRKILETSALRRFFERRIAKKCLRGVNAVTAVSEAVVEDIRHFLPDQTPELIIGHFAEFIGIDPHIYSETEIHLFHAGGFSLSDRRRRLGPVIDALSKAGRRDLHLHIAGRLSGDELALIENTSSFKITSHGPVSLERSLSLQLGADALILITPENSHALPGKFAEYDLTGKPILIQGGGSWLNLVDEPDKLIPLGNGAANLKKTQKRQSTVKTGNSQLYASKLAAFCNEV